MGRMGAGHDGAEEGRRGSHTSPQVASHVCISVTLFPSEMDPNSLPEGRLPSIAVSHRTKQEEGL